MTEHPTIFALSSGRPPAAIAVIRISGSRAGAALETLGVKIPAPRKAGLARVRDPRSQEIIDEALVLWFPAPHSETGEDTAELQLHGGRAVIAAVLEALGRIDGLRMAEPGEFTRRAFENGKLDLTAVEGLADLVSAETQGQRRQAFRQMKGLLGNRAETWRQRLIQALALVEARIDFSDEGDVPENLVAPALAIARELEGEIAQALADGGRGDRRRDGLVVAIAGPPNAGKSTLLNRLARREAAIVSPYAGTTRDVIEVHLDLGGLPVTLVDTAGIRDAPDPVEMEGVRRARERAASADLVLWVVDASAAPSTVIPGRREAANPESRATHAAADVGGQPFGRPRNGDSDAKPLQTPATSQAAPPVWLIRNKIDLLAAGDNNEHVIQGNDNNERKVRSNEALTGIVNAGLTRSNELIFSSNEHVFKVSASTGAGFDPLLAQLDRFAGEFMAGAETALVTRQRHRQVLTQGLEALRRALAVELGSREDLLAEELRLAAASLGRLTGRVDVEDILDVIFRDFCIGK
jgi:tRNA modification GTPase